MVLWFETLTNLTLTLHHPAQHRIEVVHSVQVVVEESTKKRYLKMAVESEKWTETTVVMVSKTPKYFQNFD